MMGDGGYWREWEKHFEQKGYVCHAPTLRMHDTPFDKRPDPKLGKVGITDYVDDIRSLLQTLDEKPIIIVHSMGALITQILAAEGLAHKVVLIAPAPPSGIIALSPSLIKSFLPMLSSCCFWKRPLRLSFPATRYALTNLLQEDEARLLYDLGGRWESGKAIMQMGLWFLDATRSTYVDASKVTVDMLVISGAQDHSIPVWLARKVAHRYPTARYLEYPDHAH